MKQLFFILIALSIVLSSCKEEEEYGGIDNVSRISENLYPLLFDTVSNWKYKNTENGIVDSLVLIANKIDTTAKRNIGKGYTNSDQVYLLTYSSEIFGEYTEQYIGYVIKSGFDLSRYNYHNYVYLSSFKVGDARSNATIAAIYDSLIVLNKTYYNVVKMDISKDTFIHKDMNLYYVDSIGVIKKEIKEENNIIETWELMEYQVTLYEIE